MTADDPRIAALPDIHGHAKGEHKAFAEERPIPYTARMLFLWFFHACRRGSPRFLMVADHINYLTFEDPAAVNLVRRALKLAAAGDLYGAAETAGVDVGHAATVSEGLRKGMRYSIGAEVDNDPRSRPDAQNIVDAMRPDATIRSVHFLPITHPVLGENWMWPFDNPEFKEFYEVVGVEQTWEMYVAALLDAIEKLPAHIVGHFYVPAKFGHWPADELLQRYEDRLVAACAERGLAIELNSRYFYKHFAHDDAQLQRYRNANLRLLRKAKGSGVPIAVGSDAHSPRDQGAGFADVLALLDAAEINEIAFPINGRLARVALRVTEEIMRQRSAAAVPPSNAVSGFGRSEMTVPARNGSAGAEALEAPEELVTAAVPPGEPPSASAIPAESDAETLEEPAAGDVSVPRDVGTERLVEELPLEGATRAAGLGVREASQSPEIPSSPEPAQAAETREPADSQPVAEATVGAQAGAARAERPAAATVEATPASADDVLPESEKKAKSQTAPAEPALAEEAAGEPETQEPARRAEIVAGEPPPAASGKARRIAKPRTKPEPPKPVAESASVALERAADGDEGTPKRELPAPVPPAEPLRKPTKRAAKKPRRQAGPTGKPASSKKAASAKKGGAKKSLARSGAKPLNKTKKKSAPSRKTSTKATKRTLSQAKRAASAKKNAAKKAAPKKKSSKTKR